MALFAASHRLEQEKRVKSFPLRDHVAAVSVGMVDGTPCLDLPYEEDVRAETDMNVVMTGLGGLVEVQGTAEREPFSRAELDTLLDLASAGIASLVKAQKQALGPMLEQAAIPPLRRLALGPASLDLGRRPRRVSARPRLLLASANQGKLRELRTILDGLPVELVGLDEAGLGEPPEVEETGDTFLENALLKGRAYAAWSGLAAVADDSGLEVDALGGAPGVRSARYAGQGPATRPTWTSSWPPSTGVPPERRTARFRCAAVLVDPAGGEEGREWHAEAAWEGRLLDAPRGSGGFGYDPVFLPDGWELTSAEVDQATKDAASHRGKAPPEVEETGDTFLENALLKARAYADWSGLAAVADDSGLEVDALGGAPGVRSARYAGQGASDQANLDKLLAELTGVPPERRTARFRCTAVLVDPGLGSGGSSLAPRKTGASGTPRPRGRVGCWTRPGAPGGSATTRCSSPTAGTGPAPRSTRRPRTPPPTAARPSAPCARPSRPGPGGRRALRRLTLPI